MEEFKSFYTEGDRKVNTWCRWSDRLDTYGCGCAHNCSYCYARSLLDFRGLWHPDNPAVADKYEIRKVISRKLKPGDVIRLGGMTDCFQPAERIYRRTLEAIRMCNWRGIHYLIVTKSPLILEYADTLSQKLAHIQISITSTDAATSKRMEPGAPLPAARIKAVEQLSALGFDTSVRLSPFVPEMVDLDVINAIKCDKILIEFLKVSPRIKKWFDIDYSPYTLKCGSYLHLPLNKKIELANLITGYKERTVGEFVPAHHKYFSQHFNANPDDCCNLRI